MTSTIISRKSKNQEKFIDSKYDFLYPHIDDPNFNIKIAEKKEFNETKYDGRIDDKMTIEEQAENMCKAEFELAPHQLFVRNFLSFNTPYNSLLLFHGLGTGKTCSAITIAEEMREYLNQLGVLQRIIIVASPNVQDNFKNQLFDESKLELENGFWKMNTCVGYKLLKEINPTNMKNMEKKKIVSQIKRIISASYLFLGYREFNSWVGKKINPPNASSMSESQIKFYQEEQIQKLFNNRLIVIDEVHNIRITKDTSVDNKRVAQTLMKLAETASNMRLLLLSATPMFNSYKEIIWLLNLMNINDNRSTIDIKDIFDKNGNFKMNSNGQETGKSLLIKKLTGYISFVRGENPFTFPYRIFPKQFDPDSSSINIRYPKRALNGKEIIQPLEKLDIFTKQIGTFQEEVYYYIIENLKKTSGSNLKKSFENMDSFGYNELQYPIESLNMTYPLKDFTRNTKGIATHDLIGKNGLQRVMTFVETGSEKKDFEYDSDILQTFGRIFSPSEIGKYSSKIESVIQQVQKTSGITLIFSQYIDGGIIPMALALEELGFQRFGDTKSLFKDRPSNKMQGAIPKYVIISGEKNISPNNLLEINAVSDKNNKNGSNIKVALISRAGSEGIDFKNIRDVHILDPWYNTNRIEQIIGRAIRLKSHCALPFIQRNARIFVYGTLLSNMEDEAADMYIHRVAELKALQIGNITRTLKETAVDCILNHEQNNFTEDHMNTIIKINLADGSKIDYPIGDKPYSAICDYLESCSYTCKPDISGPFDLKTSTYDETFINYNSDKIIQRIKDLFSENYFYKKVDLIKSINIKKMYPIDHINYAIQTMIEDKNIIVSDIYEKPGNIIQVDDYLLFQPLGFKNNYISTFERTRPVDFKREKLLIKLNNTFDEDIEIDDNNVDKTTSKSKSPDSITDLIVELEDLYSKYNSVISIKRGDNDKAAFVSKVFNDMSAEPEFKEDILQKILIDHIMDYLSHENKLLIINYLYSKDTYSPFETLIKQHIDSKIIHFNKTDQTPREGLILLIDNNSTLYINDVNQWRKAEYVDKEAFSKHNVSIYHDKYSRINRLIGYIEIKKLGNMFKTLDNSEKENKGRRCNTDKKAEIIKLLNMVVGHTKFNKLNTKDYKAAYLCILLEFTLRYYNYDNKNNKLWFVDPDMAKFIELKNKN
jgi:superfamily II DNA or RNA helicase